MVVGHFHSNPTQVLVEGRAIQEHRFTCGALFMLLQHGRFHARASDIDMAVGTPLTAPLQGFSRLQVQLGLTALRTLLAV